MKSFAAAVAAGLVLAVSGGMADTRRSPTMWSSRRAQRQSGLYADASGRGRRAAQMAVEDFGGKVSASRSRWCPPTIRTSPTSASSIARNWYRHRQGRRDRRRADLLGRARRSRADHARRTGSTSTPAPAPPISPARPARRHGIHWTYDTYALANVHRQAMVKHGGDSWFFITADYAFGHALERDTADVRQGAGGKVLGGVRHPAEHRRTSRPSCCRRRPPRRKVDRARQCRRRHHQRHQAGGRVRHRRRRPEAGGAPVYDHRHPRARPQDGAGPDHHRRLLLGPERRDPRLRQALRRAKPGACRP